MAKSARTTSYSSLDPLMSLTIDGPVNGDTDCSLKQNRNILLGRGTEDYILALREGILEGYTVPYRIPEMWERNWNYKLGPIQTPILVENMSTKLWLKPETFEQPTDGSNFVESWADNSGINNNVEQSVSADKPILNAKAATTLNSFKSVTAAAADNLVKNIALTTNFEVDVSAENFGVAVFLKTHASSTATQYVLNINPLSAIGSFAFYMTSGTAVRTQYQLTSNRWNSSISADTNYIFVAGSKNNVASLRINGTDAGSAAGSTATFDLSGSDELMIINNIVSTPNSPFLGELFEVIYFKQDDNNATTYETIAKKLEGYLAHKYLQTGSLPASHPYKSDPPRVSVVG